jgi:hypothetical protein
MTLGRAHFIGLEERQMVHRQKQRWLNFCEKIVCIWYGSYKCHCISPLYLYKDNGWHLPAPSISPYIQVLLHSVVKTATYCNLMTFPFFWNIMRCHNPEERKPQLQRCENPKSRYVISYCLAGEVRTTTASTTVTCRSLLFHNKIFSPQKIRSPEGVPNAEQI